MKKQVGNIDELISQLKDEPALAELYIDTSIKDTSEFDGFPLMYKYTPEVTVKTLSNVYSYSQELGMESPDEEAVRSFASIKALETGLQIADRLTDSLPSVKIIKINDLTLRETRIQLETHKAELNRINEVHKYFQY